MNALIINRHNYNGYRHMFVFNMELISIWLNFDPVIFQAFPARPRVLVHLRGPHPAAGPRPQQERLHRQPPPRQQRVIPLGIQLGVRDCVLQCHACCQA